MPFPLPTAAVATDQAPGSTGNGHVCVPAAGLLQRLALSGGAEPPSPCGHGAPDTSRPGGSTSYPRLRHAFLFYLNRQSRFLLPVTKNPA